MDDERFNTQPSVKGRRLNVLPDNPERHDRQKAVGPGRFPKWLHRKLPQGKRLWETQQILTTNRLPTVCEEAKCPNLLDCWSRKTATFLAMGKACTRNCGFCDIDFAAQPKPLEPDEPARIATSVQSLGLKHVVITMVARDDLLDGGAAHLAAIIEAVREQNRHTTIEILTSDFQGDREALATILRAKPHIFNHNIETVRALTPRVRHKASYERTLEILAYVRAQSPTLYTKSGLMVGLGESQAEVEETLRDLYAVGCHIVTIGHYLQPQRHKLRVKAFITPEQFDHFRDYGLKLGIPYLYSGPFVRSSYNAETLFETIQNTHAST